MPAGGSFSTVAPASVAIAVLLALIAAGTPPSHPLPGSPAVPSTGGSCVGAHLRSTYDGTLAVDGGPLLQGVTANATVRFSYFVSVWVIDEPAGIVSSEQCDPLSGSATTGASGGFSFDATTPRSYCEAISNGSVCTDYSSAIGPLTPTLAAPMPNGYALSFNATSAEANLALVWQLEGITLAPGGSTLTVAPDAPTPMVASGWQGNGSASPLDVDYTWTLNGTGWAFSTEPVAGRAAVVAAPGATAGTLTLRASATVNGTVLSPQPLVIALSAVTTTVLEAELNRTLLDVGSAVSANVTAVGAAGYDYRAWVDPGLGLEPVEAPCSATPYGPGTVLATCLANFTYTGPGTAQPAVNVTNGFSTALAQFPAVTVDSAAALWVTPGAPIGYALSPVPVRLIVTAGSGTPPFEGACLDPGVGTPICTTAPGPNWTFDPVYPSAGEYSASAWAVDSGGTNRSLAFLVSVVAPLAVSPLELATANATVGANLSVSSTIGGGDLPGLYWWNASGTDVPLGAGSVASDGRLTLSFVPSTPGSITLTLTARDALGTVVTAVLAVRVGPAPAVRVTETGAPPAPSVTVGDSVPLAWMALDGSGQPVGTFSAGVDVTLSGPGSAAPRGWVNVSSVGAVADLGNGTFEVPGGAWINGTLGVTVGVFTAGTLTVTLTGPGLPGPVPEVRILATPDTSHLRLFAPRVALSGARANETFWQVEDRFGNAVPGANVTIRSVWGSTTSDELVTAISEANGTTGMWVNYSAPGPDGGTVAVLDAASAVVLGPWTVPAAAGAASPTPPYGLVLALVGVGAVAGGVTVGSLRRARRSPSGPSDEAELQRLAEGRTALVELVRRHGPADLSEIETTWQPSPAPADLADWLASLVADGTLGATVGPDGKARFCLAPGPSAPRVTLDTEAFDEALRRRDEELRGGEPDPQDGSRPTRS